MKIFLVAGAEHKTITETALKKITIINKTDVTLDGAADFLRENTPSFDKILVTDGGLSTEPEGNIRDLESLLHSFKDNIIVVTRDYLLEPPTPGVSVVISRRFRPTDAEIGLALKDAPETKEKGKPRGFLGWTTKKPEEKGSRWHDNGKKKDKSGEEKVPTSELSIISSKVVVVTGHRGSGVTSTAANIAQMACDKGIKTIFVDLDIEYRGANLYFGAFMNQANNDDDINPSLVRMLAMPQAYETQAICVERNLWVTSLGYEFKDARLIAQHYIDAKIIGLLTSLKHEFDLVVVDFPLCKLTKVPALLNSVDTFALCIVNNIYSVVSTMRGIERGFEARSDISYLASKTKLVVTKYNDESLYEDEVITPDKIIDMIESGSFSDDFTSRLGAAGKVSYTNEFDRQIESDISVIYEDDGLKKDYEGILLRLMGAGTGN